MGFKMKGPGLPGFRKQASSGFYKSSGFNINTSNRSPMKQTEETGGGYDERLQTALDEQRTEISKLTPEEQAKVDWSAIVTKTKQQVKDGITKTEKSTYQEGIIEGEKPTSYIKPGDPGYEAWVKAVEGGAGKQFEDTLVYRTTYEVNTDEKPKVKDTEWTNFKIGYNRIGQGTSSVKHDVNDGSFRYNITQGDSGSPFGELSADDINNLVKDGKFKYEVKDGKDTGKLLMSKDYYENSYQPMMEMAKEGEANRAAWQEEKNEFLNTYTKNIRKELNKQGYKEGGKKYKEAYSDAVRQAKASRKDIFNSKGGVYGDNPPWMRGDPNYGGVDVGIYNDDEVLQGTADPKLINTNANFYGVENLQGSRPNDWTKDSVTGKYVLKEGAKTLDLESWNEMDQDEKTSYLKESLVNSKKSETGSKGAEKTTGATPSNIANTEVREGTMSPEEDFDDGGDVSVRL